MMMMSSVNFNPHGTKLTRVIMINYAHGVDRVSWYQFWVSLWIKKRNKSPKTKLLAKKWTPLSFTQTFSHSHLKKKLISTSNANFLRKKKKSKNKEHIGKNIKTDINNTDCVSLFWKFMYIHKYRTREREGRKNVRSYGMTQEQKTHSPWNALQDNENISIIKTHRTTCAAKMSNNAFLFLWQTRSRVIYKRYVRATELFNLYQNDLLPLQFCV